jgi:hypothetical protein
VAWNPIVWKKRNHTSRGHIYAAIASWARAQPNKRVQDSHLGVVVAYVCITAIGAGVDHDYLERLARVLTPKRLENDVNALTTLITRDHDRRSYFRVHNYLA